MQIIGEEGSVRIRVGGVDSRSTVHSHACSINLKHILLPSEAGAAVITHTESGEARAFWNDNVEPSATCSLLTSDHQAAQAGEHISLRLKRNVVALSQQGWLL